MIHCRWKPCTFETLLYKFLANYWRKYDLKSFWLYDFLSLIFNSNAIQMQKNFTLICFEFNFVRWITLFNLIFDTCTKLLLFRLDVHGKLWRLPGPWENSGIYGSTEYGFGKKYVVDVISIVTWYFIKEWSLISMLFSQILFLIFGSFRNKNFIDLICYQDSQTSGPKL